MRDRDVTSGIYPKGMGVQIAPVFHSPSRLDQAASWLEEYGQLVNRVADAYLSGELYGKPLGGLWPTVNALGRGALRHGETTDVFSVLKVLPAPVGLVTPTGEVLLRVRALATTSVAGPVVADFVRVLELAAERLKGEDPEPRLDSMDLTETLGMTSERASRVGPLVLAEDWMFNGGSSPPGSWERSINESTRYIVNVHTVEDYLRVEGECIFPQAPQARLPDTAQDVGRPDTPVSGLHPAIAQSTSKLLQGGHNDAAVRAGILGLRDLLREASGLGLDGTALAGAALGGPNPPVRLADVSTREGKAEQEGWRQLTEGCFAALRNPLAHRELNLSADEAHEALALASMLARRFEGAGVGAESSQPAVDAAQR